MTGAAAERFVVFNLRLLAATFVLSCAVAVLFYVGPIWGGAVALAAALAAGGSLVSASTLVLVTDQELRVGRAVLELAYVDGCRALSPEQTATRTGSEADARAYLVLRPYIDTAVEVTLDDLLGDPTAPA